MKKDVFIDPLNKKYHHAFFNGAILKGYKEKAILVGFKSHIENVKEIVNCESKPVRDCGVKEGIIRIFLRGLKEGMFSKKRLVFLCFDNTLIPILLLLAYPFLFKTSIYFIIHNNLTTLVNSRFKRKLHKVVTYIYSARVLVLTQEMEEIYTLKIRESNCKLLPHPNYLSFLGDKEFKQRLLPVNKINIVALGRQSHLMIDWIKETDLKKYNNLQINIFVKDLKENKVTSNGINLMQGQLSFSQYYSVLDQADFCLFSDDKTVENRASGILLDCITLKCPIIFPNFGPFLEYRNFGLGFGYDDKGQLLEILSEINENKKSRDDFRKGFIGAQKYSSLENVRDVFGEE